MTAQHTPGPWAVYQPTDRAGNFSSQRPEIVAGDTVIAELRWNGNSEPHVAANAALIARAPDLLAENGRLREALAQVIGARELGHAQGIAQAALAEKE